MKALIADCIGIIMGVDPLDTQVLSCAPRLRATKYSVNVGNIDLDYCRAHGIRVSRTEGTKSGAVADYAMALMLTMARRVPAIDRKCCAQDWGKLTARDVSYTTLDLFGLSAIGHLVARRVQGFDMKVIAYGSLLAGRICPGASH